MQYDMIHLGVVYNIYPGPPLNKMPPMIGFCWNIGAKNVFYYPTSQLANLASLYSDISTISAFFGTNTSLILSSTFFISLFLHLHKSFSHSAYIKLRHPFQWIFNGSLLLEKCPPSLNIYEHKHLVKPLTSTTATHTYLLKHLDIRLKTTIALEILQVDTTKDERFWNNKASVPLNLQHKEALWVMVVKI